MAQVCSAMDHVPVIELSDDEQDLSSDEQDIVFIEETKKSIPEEDDSDVIFISSSSPEPLDLTVSDTAEVTSLLETTQSNSVNTEVNDVNMKLTLNTEKKHTHLIIPKRTGMKNLSVFNLGSDSSDTEVSSSIEDDENSNSPSSHQGNMTLNSLSVVTNAVLQQEKTSGYVESPKSTDNITNTSIKDQSVPVLLPSQNCPSKIGHGTNVVDSAITNVPSSSPQDNSVNTQNVFQAKKRPNPFDSSLPSTSMEKTTNNSVILSSLSSSSHNNSSASLNLDPTNCKIQILDKDSMLKKSKTLTPSSNGGDTTSQVQPADSSSTLPLKKRLGSTAPASTGLLRLCNVNSNVQMSSPTLQTPAGYYGDNRCSDCAGYIAFSEMSGCLKGHRCCRQCLQQRTINMLAKSEPGNLQCTEKGCDSFFAICELKRTLPQMVIEILEEKLDREYMEYAANLAMANIQDDIKVPGNTIVEAVDNKIEKKEDNVREEITLPDNWDPSVEYTNGYKLVEVASNSVEYIQLALQFHSTMFFPNVDIKRIKRVQNPTLWHFFQIKKKSMSRDSPNGKVLEKQLFHGTKEEVIDPICRENFDWRLCGTNGTAYGQGTYFARDARYSHQFIDKNRLQSRSQFRNLMHLPVLKVSQLALMNNPFLQVSNLANTPQVPNFLNPPPTAPTNNLAGTIERKMFVARVLVGQVARGNTTLRKPPPLNTTDPYGRAYDSCVDDIHNPSIYVIFERTQCYPEYIIEYEM